MSYIFENIQFNSDIPMKIFIHNLNYAQNHWHDALEILFVLEGSIHIGIGNSVYQLEKEDLIVINPHEIHTTYAERANLVLVLQISDDWVKKYGNLNDIYLDCNSVVSKKVLHMDRIRTVLAQMMWVYNNHSAYFELRLQSYLLEIIYQMFVYFQAEKPQVKLNENSNYMPRLSNIIHYIHEHYDQNITLQDLADKEYLSVSYISRFFKKKIGTSFKDYIIKLRLEHAVKDLLYTDKSISQLSFDNGFPNNNSFLETFKETYKEAPSVYRKKAKEDYQFLYGPNIQSNNYFEMQNVNIFSSLYKYLNISFQSADKEEGDNSVDIDYGDIDVKSSIKNITSNWKNLITIGKAKDALDLRVREQLNKVQKEIGFRYIRFHGIFDDEMKLYNEDSEGNPLLDFTLVDKVIDYLYEINLKPFIELGFMPSQLAKNKHTMFSNRPSIISMPKDIQKWCYLVEKFTLHCINRYGISEVEDWYFEFWNEPDIIDVFWYDTMEDYLYFYFETFKTIKNISTALRVGGPAVCNLENTYEWLQTYFTFCSVNNCQPDFFSFHFYLHEGKLIETQNATRTGLKRVILSEDADYLKHTIEKIKEMVILYNYDAEKIHLTEWNASPSHRDFTHDTLYKAAFIMKNVLENMDSINSFGFWTISDLIEEFPIPEECFHGGLGVITYNGIEKAGYHAFRFLNKLGDKKIASGSGYYITASSNGYQILLYNYYHYDSLYCNMDHSGISRTKRYGIYGDTSIKTIQMTLNGIEKADYDIIEYTVNRSYGSAFDAWVEMGAPQIITNEKKEYLIKKSVPQYHESTEIIDNTYTLVRKLAPHEIRLIEINFHRDANKKEKNDEREYILDI